MAKFDWLILFFTVLINSAASLLVKKGASAITGGVQLNRSEGLFKMLLQALNIYTILGLTLLGVGFTLYVVLVSRVPVSIAQSMLSLAYVFVAIGAFYFFGEAITFTKIFGISIIILGVYFISTA